MSIASRVPTQTSGDKTIPALFHVATMDTKTGTIYLKVVNPQSVAQVLDVLLEGAKMVRPDGTRIQLAGTNLKDMNTLTEPMKVAPKTVTITGLSPKFNMTFPAYSITVLKIETR